jgi:hypothetical protein
MQNSERYSKKELRDIRAKELKEQGYTVTRSSIRNQQLHPMYVTDLRAGLSQADCGFGNTIYKTFFAVLYNVEWQ